MQAMRKGDRPMTREDIIRMAKQAGMEQDGDNFFSKNYEEMDVHIDDLKRLVELAKAEEREACARVCEALPLVYLKDGERWLKGQNGKPDKRLKDLAPHLEEAWEAEQLLKNKSGVEFITQAYRCADAIRARGKK